MIDDFIRQANTQLRAAAKRISMLNGHWANEVAGQFQAPANQALDASIGHQLRLLVVARLRSNIWARRSP